MSNSVPELDQQVEALQSILDLGTFTLQGGYERESQPAEVAAQRSGSWVLHVQLAALGQQGPQNICLTCVRNRDVSVYRLVVEVAAVDLELGDEHDEQTPV